MVGQSSRSSPATSQPRHAVSQALYPRPCHAAHQSTLNDSRKEAYRPQGLHVGYASIDSELPPPLAEVALEHVARGHAEDVAELDRDGSFPRIRVEMRGVVPD